MFSRQTPFHAGNRQHPDLEHLGRLISQPVHISAVVPMHIVRATKGYSPRKRVRLCVLGVSHKFRPSSPPSTSANHDHLQLLVPSSRSLHTPHARFTHAKNAHLHSHSGRRSPGNRGLGHEVRAARSPPLPLQHDY
jgi:hypothetical protein